MALPEGSLLVGRGPAASGLRLEERNVSRRHARFLRAGGLVLVEDLGSRNGTWVNGARVEGRRRLRAGDRIRIGDFELLLEEADGALAAAGRSATAEIPPPLPQRLAPRPAPPGGGPGGPSALRRLAGAARAALSAVARARRR